MKKVFHRFPSGVTLVELMIAVALISIISLGVIGSFGNIAKALQFSKSRSLASNLAQEQMQVLKQQSFNKILVTTSTAYLPDFGTEVPYDTGYYYPETISEGGIRFTRYTHIEVTREDSGTLNYYGPVPDTGMKAILVTVVWVQGADTKKMQIRNILGNIDTTMTNSIFSGKVKIWPTTTGITGARVTVAENVGYEDTTNGSGNYSINVYPGNYTLVATAEGYFTARRTVSVAANSTSSSDFDLFTMGSGTVRGTAWYNDHLVISQVVGSSMTYQYDAAGFDQEWIEVFNPTTSTWASSDIGIRFQRASTIDASPVNIAITYHAPSIAPGGFYLFANTTTISGAGTGLSAAATWNKSAGTNDTAFAPRFTVADPNIITTYTDNSAWGRGSVQLYRISDGAILDTVGWRGDGSQLPPLSEGTPMNFNQGLNDMEQFYRYSSTSGYNPAYGPAYDSASNDIDFDMINPVGWVPKSTSSAIVPAIAGVPAYGAYVSAIDGLSQVAKANLAGVAGNPPYAEFVLTSVATGTWTVFIASGAKVLDISTVTVVANTTTLIPNSVTSPSWPATGINAVILNENATQGFVSGSVTNVLGNAISPAINVNAGGTVTQASISNGTYFLAATTGTYDIVANNNNQNATYISQTSQTVVVELGQVNSGINFILSQGGRVRGSATRDGINAIPGVSFAAIDTSDMARAQAISGADGQFLLINLATGTYSIEPILGSGEASSPATVVSTVSAGNTINVGTFTISGAFGYVRGNVTTGGSTRIRTGVLIIASTATVSAPPMLSANTLSGAGYYTTNSYEDGTYVLDVRGSTVPYKVYAYYTTFNVSTPTTTVKSNLSVSVTAGNSTSGINFNW